MKIIYLVSCVSKKQARPAEARTLYTSTWFKKATAYAERAGSEWFILSAKYGLLGPADTISPYDEMLNSLPRSERRKWAATVLQSLKTKVSSGDTIVFLAGVNYREFLVGPLQNAGVKVKIPMKGLAIGKQNQWLTKQLAATETVSRT